MKHTIVGRGALDDVRCGRSPRACRATALLGAALALFTGACSSDDEAKTGPGDGAPGGAAGASGASGSSGAPGTSGGGGTTSGGTSGNAGSGGQGAGGGSGPQFWQSFSTSLCHHYLHCYGENYGGADLRAMGGEAECSTALVKELAKLHPRVAALNAAVAAGTLSIQNDNVQKCLAAVASCDYPLMTAPKFEIHFEDVPPCREVFEGTVPNGGDCDFSEECAGDAACAHAAGAPSGACAGTCQPRKQAGETCSVDRECGAPSPTAWAVCQEGQCLVVNVHAPSGSGAECGRVPTTDALPCGDDLWCPAGAFGLTGSSNCGTPVADGMACDTSSPGASECLQGWCVSGKCAADVVGQKVGDPCVETNQICNSFSQLACNGGQCVKADGAAGSACNSTYWFQKALCPPLSFSATGSACSGHDSCASGICAGTHGCVQKLCSAH